MQAHIIIHFIIKHDIGYIIEFHSHKNVFIK